MYTPYVKVDLAKVQKNITNMVNGLKKQNILYRPHIKSHKCVELAKLQLDLGAIGVTCATLTELDVMLSNDIDNILLAMPLVGDQHLQKLLFILKKNKNSNVLFIVDSIEGLHGLNQIGKILRKKINVLVAINGGADREGLQPKSVLPFIKILINKDWVEFKGLFTYYGHIYDEDKSQFQNLTKEEAQLLVDVKEIIEAQGISVDILSAGSTLSSQYPKYLNGITESRAGNCIFYDWNAVQLGITTIENCALTVLTTVIHIHRNGKATIDAGSKALSSDRSVLDRFYGKVINKPNINIVKLNEEHGYIEYDPNKITLKVGDVLEVIPNHSCVVSNLYNSIFLFYQNDPIKEIKVDARGRSY